MLYLWSLVKLTIIVYWWFYVSDDIFRALGRTWFIINIAKNDSSEFKHIIRMQLLQISLVEKYV